jgi:hypothetical protein
MVEYLYYCRKKLIQKEGTGIIETTLEKIAEKYK